MIRPGSALGIACALVALAPSVLPQAAPRPQPYCIRGVYLGRSSEQAVTLLLRNGTIEAVLDATAPAPPGARVIEGDGLHCLPAFLDAFSRQGCVVPQPVTDQDLPPDVQADVGIDMRLANRKGIQPAFRTVEALALTKEQSEAWRKNGFGAVLVAPGGELLAGTSTLATTREAAMRDVVVRDLVFAHAAFAASGPGYPSTPMGYFGQLRQFLLDAQRHVELEQRYEQGRPGLRPPFDDELEEGAELVSGRRVLVCQADRAGDIERWIRLADEFGLSIAISGGREAWRVRDTLAARGIPVALTLDWGKEVEDPFAKKKSKKDSERKDSGEPEAVAEDEGASSEQEPAKPADSQEPDAAKPEKPESDDPSDYEEPLEVRVERRKKWEEGRDSALRLTEAGVRFAFGTAEAKPSELLERVRTLVEEGLSADVALAALTTEAAEILGVSARLGRVAAGYDATFTLWRSDPLTDEKAAAAWVFVDGFPTEFKEDKKKDAKPAEGLDPSGTWQLVFESEEEGPRVGTLVLEMEEDGELSGTLKVDNPIDGSKVETAVEGRLSGEELELEATLDLGEIDIEAVLTATVEKDELEGKASFRGPWGDEPMTQPFSGTRQPE